MEAIQSQAKATPALGGYRRIPFEPARRLTIDAVVMGRRRHHVPVIAEVDVTVARREIARRKAATGEGLSFTAWVVKCLAQAASEHPRVHAARQGRRRIVLFDDVDVGVLAQRQVAGAAAGETTPMGFVVHRAQSKSVEQIHDEIRAAQGKPIERGEQVLTRGPGVPSPRVMRFFQALPAPLRRAIFWNRFVRNPLRGQQAMGTIGVTSVGMFGAVGGGDAWAVSTSIHPLSVAVGAIARKPWVVGARVEPREVLSLTVMFDHDVVDGAPVAAFLPRLRELMEAGYGLPP